MIVVVARRSDDAARALRHHCPGDVRRLDTVDLSTPGWSATLPGRGRSTAVVAGEPIDSGEIAAVLTRVPCVEPGELGHIAAGERPYVASEMNAFLLWWLSALECPVVNRPAPPELCGPGWRPERWCAVAAGLGVPVEPVRRAAVPGGVMPSADPASDVVVTVVGTRCIGEVDPVLARRTRVLAAAARADLLCLAFTGADGDARFVGAHCDVDLSDAAVRDAVLELLDGAPSR